MRKLNKERLEKILRDRLKEQMEWYQVSAADILVLQDGQEVCSIREGYQNWNTKEPLRPDAMFRLASMTKPVTGVATLIALDKGYFKLTDKVEDYLPEFADMHIGKIENDELVIGEKNPTPLQIWHLLAHFNGIMNQTPVGRAVTAAAPKASYASRDTMIAYAATQPLSFAPETEASYTTTVTFDIVAKIIEQKSGMTYPEFLQTYIFDPLGIKDLTYCPTEEQWERMIAPTDQLGALDFATVDLGRHTFEGYPLSYAGAGAGLAGTMAAYTVFAEMLQNGGEYNGVRIFSKERMKDLTTPYVPRGLPGRGRSSSWGLGVRVVDTEIVLPIGSFGWSGAYGTHFWVDPVNKITAIYLRSSRWYDSHGGGNISIQFEKDVMAALEP